MAQHSNITPRGTRPTQQAYGTQQATAARGTQQHASTSSQRSGAGTAAQNMQNPAHFGASTRAYSAAAAATTAPAAAAAPAKPQKNPVLKVLSVLSTILVIAAVLLAVALVGARLIGLDVRTVVSGSMEPTYHTGSVIWVKPCEAEEVQVGDAITFVLNEDLDVVTHRVVEIDTLNRRFITKGDANDCVDGAPVLYENLIGKPVASVPKLGYFVSYVQQPPGLYVAIAVAALLVLLVFLPDMLFRDEKEPVPSQPRASGAQLRPPGAQPRHAAAAQPRAPGAQSRASGAQPRAPGAQHRKAEGGGCYRP